MSKAKAKDVENSEDSSEDGDVEWPLSPRELIERYREFVMGIVCRVYEESGKELAVEELKGYGFQGLLEAARRFEPERGVKFVSFAHPRVRGAIWDGLRHHRWGRCGTSCRVHDDLGGNVPLGQAPEADGDGRLAGAEIPRERFAGVPDSESGTSVVLLEPARVTAFRGGEDDEEQELFRHFEVERVREALEELSAMEREIIVRYHIADETLTAIAEDLGSSKGWISRLKQRAMEQVREILAGGDDGAAEEDDVVEDVEFDGDSVERAA